MAAATNPQTISDQGRIILLRLAREAITARLEDRSPPSIRPEDPALLEHRGAFVTLKINGRLRGCIGHIEGVSPLWLAVRENAESAAFRDPRFPALGRDELDEVHIEISALTPLLPSSPEDIVVGRDGVVVERRTHRAVLLPQVAQEYGWDAEAFLDATCRKAGLELGCWRDSETLIKSFSADVFAED